MLLTKYFVNGGVGGQGTVKDGELPLESLWDVIATSSRVDHGCKELDVHNVGELPWFLQIEEPILLHELPGYLISYLGWERRGISSKVVFDLVM